MNLQMRLSRLGYAVGVFCLVLGTAGVEAGQVDGLRMVALSGTSAPGTGGQFLDPFALQFDGTINSQGQVLFSSRRFEQYGIWFESAPNQISNLALHNAVAPGFSSFKRFDSYAGGQHYLNDDGDVAFGYGFRPHPVDNYDPHTLGIGRGLWSTTGGSGLRIVAADGLPFPLGSGGPNVFSVNNFRSALNEAGQIAFTTSSTTQADLWVDTPGQSPRHVVKSFDPVPGFHNGAEFGYFSELALSDTGRVAFYGNLRIGPAGVAYPDDQGIWQESTSGELKLVVRRGQDAPETGGQVFTDHFLLTGPFASNGSGQLAFISEVTGPDNQRFAIYAQDGAGALRKVARMGEAVPGVPGVTFTNLGQPYLNDLGHVAFFGTDSELAQPGGYATGIWSNGGGNGVEPVVRIGQSLPGTPAGTIVSGLGGLAINNHGQVMFGAGYGIDEGDFISYVGGGIWAQDRNGNLRAIIRFGDLVDVDPGPAVDLRTVSGIDSNFVSDQRIENRSFNDLGQILLSLGFTDGNLGLFVSNLIAVPEPAGGVYAAICTMAACGWRLSARRRANARA